MRIRRSTLATALAVGALWQLGNTRELPPFPKLDITDFLPAIRQQVNQAYVAARARPSDPAANGTLGMVLDAYQQYNSAAVCYERAHELEPDGFRWLYYLGVLRLHQGKYDEAAATLRAAFRLNADYRPGQLKLAESLLNSGRWEQAARICEDLLKREPENSAAHYALGRAQAARGDLPAAIQSYRKACDLFPSYGAAHYALALAYRKAGKAPEAQQQFALYETNKVTVPPSHDPLLQAVQALDLGPDLYIRRGTALEKAGRIEEAIAEHEKALKIDPDEVQAHINLISLYGRLGQIQKAEEHYRTAIRLNPSRAEAHYDYGVLLFGQQRGQEAEQQFRQALEINPYYAEAHNNLGYLLEQRGRLDEAAKEFEAALENQPNYRLAHFHLGRILVHKGKYDEAIQHFRKTLTPEDDGTPTYLYALGAAYARAGDRVNALIYIRQARDEATARRQTQILASINKDLRILEQGEHRKEGEHHE